jgi:hypothetical protein
MSLGAYKAFEPRTLGRVLKAEVNRAFTVTGGTLAAGGGAERSVELGEVLGAITLGAVSAEAKDGNVGEGGVGAVTLGPRAKAGIYTLTCITEAANAGTFQVVDPDGYRLPDLTVGVAYVSDHINCTVSDSGEDFDKGDGFEITIAVGSGHLVALDPTAVNGAQNAVGIAAMDATAPAAATAALNVISFGAIVNGAELKWPEGATDGQKAAATAQLAVRFIDIRAEA